MELVIEQRTPEWHAQRVGKITASKLAAVCDRKKDGKPYAEYNAYQGEKVIELLTGKPLPELTGAALDHGTFYEPFARREYEQRTSTEVAPAPFIIHPTLEFVGGSPDGFIGDDGIIEIKCPFNAVNHMATLLEGKMPSQHWAQVQGLLWITGTKHCDFISYHPDFPAPLNLFVIRIHRDDPYIATLEPACTQFWGECNQMISKLLGAN